ncbi:MAG: NAD(P)-binding protein [Anaerococcus sp.]|nr:NAD(P)-binding protein [Anaerococcus sp.]MDD7044619.1 NAD(P)-binding protein [Peptoniphilaceae bacterium]MDY2919204.1 NAD(P)-binding protein [Anaerococcus sp.]
MDRKKVSVIGAGMGGLSAAIELVDRGYDVEIYEKNSEPGGKMERIYVDDIPLMWALPLL